MKKQLLFTLILTLTVIMGRLVPHLPNFTPLTVVALFSGFYLNKKYALILPLAALLISDIFLGFHSTMLYVYSSMTIVSLLGIASRRHKSIITITASTFAGSVLFFLITNFGVWVQGNLYPSTLNGLIDSYYLGLPFFRNSLLGNAFYATLLFGGYELVASYAKKNKIVHIFSKK